MAPSSAQALTLPPHSKQGPRTESRPLPGPEGEETARPDVLMGLQRVRGLSRSITQSSSPNLLVSEKKKQTLLGGTAQMAPQSPQKANKGSDPHFPQPRGTRSQGAEGQSLRPYPAELLPGMDTSSLGDEDATELLQFTIRILRQGCWGWAGAGARPIGTVRSWPSSCLPAGSSAGE